MALVRLANKDDAWAIREIYAPYVLNTAISFETEVPSLEEIEIRISKCLQKFPWIVCEVNSRIAGYAYASTHRERDAYQWTCESSVYVHDAYQGKGIGSVLYEVLFEMLKIQGFVNVYAGIALPNDASVKMHEKCGFEFFALYDNIGFKFGRWHKVGWWKHQLHNYTLSHAPPLKFSQLDREIFSDLFRNAAARIATKLIG